MAAPLKRMVGPFMGTSARTTSSRVVIWSLHAACMRPSINSSTVNSSSAPCSMLKVG